MRMLFNAYSPTRRRLPIFIFTSDHYPPQVHVRREGKLAKVLLDPIEFERVGGFNAGEQSKIIEIVRDNQTLLLHEWEKVYPPEETDSDD